MEPNIRIDACWGNYSLPGASGRILISTQPLVPEIDAGGKRQYLNKSGKVLSNSPVLPTRYNKPEFGKFSRVSMDIPNQTLLFCYNTGRFRGVNNRSATLVLLVQHGAPLITVYARVNDHEKK